MKIDSHTNTSDLLDAFIGGGLAPCITRPTRVTNSTATLIDNIYVRADYCKDCFSGILISDISDHFPVMVGVGNTLINSKELLCIKSRKFTQSIFINMEHWLNQVDWRCFYDMETDEAYSEFIKKAK